MGVWVNIMSMITLVRGLPGSGKTSFAEHLVGLRFAADDYFLESGEYTFVPSDLPKAHAWCLERATHALGAGSSIVIHNTFTQRWEMEPYFILAESFNVRLFVASIYDGGLTDEELFARNTHGVPLLSIKAMRERWEFDWKAGNPTAPWLR